MTVTVILVTHILGIFTSVLDRKFITNRLEIPWIHPGFVIIYAIILPKTDFEGRVKFLLKIL